ncbi:MAG: clostripain-related cysteine peptidase [Thermoplasmata archaeon]
MILPTMLGSCGVDYPNTGSMEAQEDAPRKWTIAMYWASDNNLDEYTEYFIELWMEYLTNREDVALCVFVDRLELPANISTLTEEGWTEIANLGEVNSSSPDTLASFVTYAMTEPDLASENFMLMVQNHGNGYLGLCSDEGLPDSDLAKAWMSIDDLGRGIRDALDATQKSIDIISLDACTLGTVEVAYELRGTASYMVSSELGVPFDGQNYIALMSGLSENPGITPLDLARKLVDDYEDWYSAPLHTYPTLYPYMQDFASLSVIDLNALGPLIDAFGSFKDAVTPKDNSIGKYLKTAAVDADISLWINSMGVWFYPDIMVMFTTLGESLRSSHPAVASCCDAIVDAADVVIIHNWASWRMQGKATGLSVFVCPSVGVYEAYWDSMGRAYDNIDLDFVSDSEWDVVLEAYYYTAKMYGNPPQAA